MAGALTAACTCRSPRRRRCCASQPSGSSAWAKWRRCVGRRRRWWRCWASAAPASRPSAARSSTSCSWRTCATLRPRPHDPLAHVRCCCCCMCHARSHEVVAFLDCDVGQPELTPPGLLSLHLLTEPLFGTCSLLAARCWLVVVEGADRHHRPELHTPAPASEVRPLQRGSASSVRLAAHARGRCVARAIFFGDATPADEPQLYLESISFLCAAADSIDAAIPMVINTNGWVSSTACGSWLVAPAR